MALGSNLRRDWCTFVLSVVYPFQSKHLLSIVSQVEQQQSFHVSSALLPNRSNKSVLPAFSDLSPTSPYFDTRVSKPFQWRKTMSIFRGYVITPSDPTKIHVNSNDSYLPMATTPCKCKDKASQASTKAMLKVPMLFSSQHHIICLLFKVSNVPLRELVLPNQPRQHWQHLIPYRCFSVDEIYCHNTKWTCNIPLQIIGIVAEWNHVNKS